MPKSDSVDWRISVFAIAAALSTGGFMYQSVERSRADTELANRNAEQLRQARATCAKDAESNFVKLGYSLDGSVRTDPNGIQTVADFKNHYSPKYGRCLMFLSTSTISTESIYDTEEIYDVEENTKFAEYSKYNRNHESEPGIEKCNVTIPGEASKTCSTHADWEQVVQNLLTS